MYNLIVYDNTIWQHFPILAFAAAGCISVSDFAAFLGIPIGITTSAIGLKMCVTTAGIKKYRSIIKKRKRKHNKMVLSAKSKLNNIEVLISKAFIDSNASHDKLVLIKNLLQGYDNMKEETKDLKI